MQDITRQNKELEDFRYDAKLFKQAYKAGIQAKIDSSKKKQIKYVRLAIGIVSVIALIFSITWVVSRIPEKYSYIRINSLENEEIFKEQDIDIIPSSQSNIDFDEIFVSAKSAIYADLNNGHIYYLKDGDLELPIASLTKLMTAIVALDKYNLDDVIEVKEDWYKNEDMEWSLELDKGDSVTVETLLYAMLISSYNDASYVIADNYPGGWQEYVKEMNRYADVLGLENTQFNNPSGLDFQGGNISTVKDLYRLSTIVYNNETIMNIIKKSYADLSWNIGSNRIYSTNAIWNKYGNIAGKTGITDEAGQCFLGITDDGKVTIVLNSLDRFADTKRLLLEL